MYKISYDSDDVNRNIEIRVRSKTLFVINKSLDRNTAEIELSFLDEVQHKRIV